MPKWPIYVVLYTIIVGTIAWFLLNTVLVAVGVDVGFWLLPVVWIGSALVAYSRWGSKSASPQQSRANDAKK